MPALGREQLVLKALQMELRQGSGPEHRLASSKQEDWHPFRAQRHDPVRGHGPWEELRLAPELRVEQYRNVCAWCHRQGALFRDRELYLVDRQLPFLPIPRLLDDASDCGCHTRHCQHCCGCNRGLAVGHHLVAPTPHEIDHRVGNHRLPNPQKIFFQQEEEDPMSPSHRRYPILGHHESRDDSRIPRHS